MPWGRRRPEGSCLDCWGSIRKAAQSTQQVHLLPALAHSSRARMAVRTGRVPTRPGIRSRIWERRYRIVIDPQIPRTLYVADVGRVMKSIDRGESWTDLPVPLDSIGGCDECLAVSILTIDPRDSSTVYACGSIGVLKSVDRGATWNAMNSGLPWAPSQ